MLSSRLCRRRFSKLRGKELVDTALTSWAQQIDPRVMGDSLLRHGYAVMDNAFHPALAYALQSEIHQLDHQLYPNATHVLVPGSAEPLLLEKKHIREMELLTVSPDQAHLNRWFDNPTIRTTMNQLVPPLHATRHMIKVQYNEGDGGCFPMHFDTYGEDGKCLTAILYLNDKWKEGHGGELALYPFPHAPVQVEPLFNRLVLFSSTQMLHRVLPATHSRMCLTTWLYKDPTPPQPSVGAQATDDAYVRMLFKLSSSPFRRHLAKLFYANEWRQSLVESHKSTTAFASYLDSFDNEIRTIEAATAKMLANFSRQNPNADIPSTPAVFMARLRREFQDEGRSASFVVPWFH